MLKPVLLLRLPVVAAAAVGLLTTSCQRDAEPAAPPPGVLVPAGAVASRDGNDVAFVVMGLDDRQGTVDLREIEVGRSLGDDREVTSGLAGGDTVVLDPPEALQDGDEVRVAGDAAG